MKTVNVLAEAIERANHGWSALAGYDGMARSIIETLRQAGYEIVKTKEKK